MQSGEKLDAHKSSRILLKNGEDLGGNEESRREKVLHPLPPFADLNLVD